MIVIIWDKNDHKMLGIFFLFPVDGFPLIGRLRDEVYHGSPVMVGDCDACDAFGLPTVDQFTPG